MTPTLSQNLTRGRGYPSRHVVYNNAERAWGPGFQLYRRRQRFPSLFVGVNISRARGYSSSSWSREAKRILGEFEAEINDRIARDLLFGGKK